MDPTAILLTFLAALGIHQGWIYEDITATPRRWAKRLPAWMRWPLLCPPCFSFWAAAAATSIWIAPSPWDHGVLLVLAGFWMVRLSVYARDLSLTAIMQAVKNQVVGTQKPAAIPPKPPSPEKAKPEVPQKAAVGEPESDEPGCPSCAAKAKAAKINQERDTIVLLTTLGNWHSSYSLTTVILDQARAAANAGFAVLLVTLQSATAKDAPPDIRDNPRIRILNFMPSVVGLRENVVDVQGAAKIQIFLTDFFRRWDELIGRPSFKRLIFSHDLCFQSWFVTYAKAIHDAEVSEAWRWYHIAHSSPDGDRQVEGDAQWRYKIPKGHKLLSLSHVQALPLSLHYDVPMERVEVLGNPRDLSSTLGFSETTAHIVRSSQMERADIVQVYPISMTRATAKGVEDVVRVLGELQRLEYSVRLVMVDAHSTDDRGRAARNDIDALATVEGVPVTWASDFLSKDDCYNGLSAPEVMQLQLYANLFVFPSRAECSPLCLMEAALAGCLLVTNHDVPSMSDIIPTGMCLTTSFPSKDLAGLARQIGQRLDASNQNITKRLVLRERSLTAYGQQLKQLADEAL